MTSDLWTAFNRPSWLQIFSRNVILAGVTIMVYASKKFEFEYSFYSSLNEGFSPSAMWENVFLLVLTAFLKIGLTSWTFGMMVRLYCYLSSTPGCVHPSDRSLLVSFSQPSLLEHALVVQLDS